MGPHGDPFAIRIEKLGHAPTADDGAAARSDRPKSDASAVAPVRCADCADSRRRTAKRSDLRRIAPCSEFRAHHHTPKLKERLAPPKHWQRGNRILEKRIQDCFEGRLRPEELPDHGGGLWISDIDLFGEAWKRLEVFGLELLRTKFHHQTARGIGLMVVHAGGRTFAI